MVVPSVLRSLEPEGLHRLAFRLITKKLRSPKNGGVFRGFLVARVAGAWEIAKAPAGLRLF